MRVSRGFLSITLLTSLVFCGLILTVLVIRFASPPKQEYLVGDISLFPPAGHPYSIEVENKRVNLANTGKDILIFHWRTPGSAGCRYSWSGLEGAFIDPCTGARFSLDGRFLVGPPHRGLDRYPVRLYRGQIFVNLSKTIEGPE